MAKGYYLSVDGGENFEAEGLLEIADYTIRYSNADVAANNIHSVKDSNDNIYISCKYIGNSIGNIYVEYGKIIKISNNGVKSIVKIFDKFQLSNTTGSSGLMWLSRDETKLFVCSRNNNDYDSLYSVNTADIIDGATVVPTLVISGSVNDAKFAIYQDRYIWTASGSTLNIYDYSTKNKVDADGITITASLAICCSPENVLYSISANLLTVCVLNGSTISKTEITLTGAFANAKQVQIDRWGDLVILTNSGTASRLLKYTTAGVLIEDKDLSVAEILGVGRTAFSLNVYSTRNQDGTLKDCQVSFENDLGLWLSEPVTRQGELFGTFTKILNTGNVTYGNCNGRDNNYSVRC